MVDEPENHTLALLREMRAEFAEMRADTTRQFAQMRAETDRQFAETRAQAAHHGELLGKVIDAVTALARGQEQLAETSKIIEGRLVRIERRVGLVDA